jgi:hypothetical protein
VTSSCAGAQGARRHTSVPEKHRHPTYTAERWTNEDSCHRIPRTRWSGDRSQMAGRVNRLAQGLALTYPPLREH